MKSPLVYADKIFLPYLIRYLNLNLNQCRIAIKQKQPTKNINEKYKREIISNVIKTPAKTSSKAMVPPKKLTKKLLTRWISKRHIRYPFMHCKDYNHLSSKHSGKKNYPHTLWQVVWLFELKNIFSVFAIDFSLCKVCLIYRHWNTRLQYMKLWFFISYEGINIFFYFIRKNVAVCRL